MIPIQFTNVSNVEEEIRIMSEKYTFKSIERYTCWWVFPLNILIAFLLAIPYYIITGKFSMDAKPFKQINDWVIDLTE